MKERKHTCHELKERKRECTLAMNEREKERKREREKERKHTRHEFLDAAVATAREAQRGI